MNNLNICIDIDGTITSPYHFISYLNEMYNRNIKEDCTIVNWFKLYDEDNEKLIERFHDKYIYSYEEAEIIDEVKQIIKDLNEKIIYILLQQGEMNYKI